MRSVPASPNAPAITRKGLPAWASAVLYVLAAAVVTVAVLESMLGDLHPLMLGKWLIVEGENQGATIEFARDGTMVLALKQNGNEIAFDGSVQMEGDGFRVTLVDPTHGFKVTHEQTILELTELRFIVQDQQGELIKMTRMR